jgi:hypothetical protein
MALMASPMTFEGARGDAGVSLDVEEDRDRLGAEVRKRVSFTLASSVSFEGLRMGQLEGPNCTGVSASKEFPSPPT